MPYEPDRINISEYREPTTEELWLFSFLLSMVFVFGLVWTAGDVVPLSEVLAAKNKPVAESRAPLQANLYSNTRYVGSAFK